MYVYFSVIFNRVLVNAVVFSALVVVWGANGTVTNIALARVLDRTSPTKVMFVYFPYMRWTWHLCPGRAPRCGLPCWRLPCGVQLGWGIQGPQQYRLVNIAPTIAPVLLGLNTAATNLGVTTAGILDAVGIHWVGAHSLSLPSVGVFIACQLHISHGWSPDRERLNGRDWARCAIRPLIDGREPRAA